ncbi:MAG: hypothetical protein JO057_12510, partial [Chloroflexi bacterium]|nr:hypothetical protein [Chloroflexota bacterium]
MVPGNLGASGQLVYIPNVAAPWPATWHPVLRQAPSGRMGNLWAATAGGAIVSHDGVRWTQQSGSATSVAAGVDGSVFAVNASATTLQHWNGSGWDNAAQASSGLTQVAVGDAAHVWVRDASNTVHQLQHTQLQATPLLGASAHVAANYDGTVWSCNGTDAHALRFVSEGSAPPTPVSAQASVHKVASTGFGTAHCLTSQNGTTQLYRYQSPYVFKTSQSYIASDLAAQQGVVQGLGNLYLSVRVGGDTQGGAEAVYTLVAVDAHTGQEVSRSVPSPNGTAYTGVVFDPIHEVVIVGQRNLGQISTPSQMLGLDARDLTRVRWSFMPPNGMNVGVRPVLSGTTLCFTDNVNTLAVYDIGSAPDARPTLLWTNSLSIVSQDEHQFPPPVVANGQIYAAWWVYAKSFGYQQVWLVTASVADGSGFGRTAVSNSVTYPSSDTAFKYFGFFQPLLVTSQSGGQSHTYVYINGGAALWQVDAAAPSTGVSYSVGSTTISSSFTYADGVVWFGDGAGALHGVDAQLHPVAHTPVTLGSGGALLTQPLVYRDPHGTSAVIVSETNTRQAGSLLLFDPSSGNVVGVPTAQTALSVLSSAVTNGVVYAAGYAAVGTAFTPTQMFGIRVDAAVQDLRAFVSDSQLLQDFDGESTPKGVARYQTCLTLVDSHKAPLPREAVKVWADTQTTLRIGTQTFSVGPGDSQYAAVQTASDGTLTIVSGGVAGDGSDKPDMSAAPVRLWAAFMDPYERIMIGPDREFHNRLATAHATPAGQSGADDPTRVNLQTTQKYGALQQGGTNSGDSLFTDEQKQQNQPQQVANAIQTLTKSVATSSNSGSAQTASWSLQAASGPDTYLAYADQPGSEYSAVNTPATRTVTVVQPVGLSYSRANGSEPPSFSTRTPADATIAIDALDGQDWRSSQYATPNVLAAAQSGTLHLGSWWGDFWGWVKNAAATITDVVVAAAEDVYVGVRFIVDGVAHVFRSIIAGVEEAVAAIGTFFVELGHLIEEVIEALSVLFHFEEIIKTQQILLKE